MTLPITKSATLLLLAAGSFLNAGCEWSTEAGDAGRTEALEFHSTSRQPSDPLDAPPSDQSGMVELVDLNGAGVAADEPERSGPLMEIAFGHVDDRPTDHLKTAEELVGKQDQTAALVELAKALYDDPQDYAAALLLGRTALRSRDVDLARKAFLLASRIDPGRADAWIFLGRLAIREGKLSQAADWARQALSVDSRRAESHNLLGRVWLARSHWDRAIRSFAKAVSLNEENFYYLNNLGLAYLMKKNYPKAVEVLEKLVGQADVTAFMRNNLGLAYEGAGRLQQAISEFKAAIDLNPSYLNAQLNLDRLTTVAKRAKDEIEVVPAAPQKPDGDSAGLILVEPEGN